MYDDEELLFEQQNIYKLQNGKQKGKCNTNYAKSNIYLHKSYSCYRTYITFIPKLFNNCYIHPYIYI